MGEQVKNAQNYVFPRGWFLVALSEEVAQGKILAVKYFNQDLIIFRTESGRVVILDAHCPHLGAHIGIGGKVEGECVRCPFHGWLYDMQGQCVEIPYSPSGRIPKRARLRAWLVQEKEGGIFLWHDPESNIPDYHLPDIDAYHDMDWIPWKMEKSVIHTHPREVIDNITDKAHFPVVHHSPIDHWENIFEGHRVVQKQGGAHLESVATYHGPGYLLTELYSENFKSQMLVCHTPVSEQLIHVWAGVMVKMEGKQRNQEAQAEVAPYVGLLVDGFFQDVAIWKYKADAPQPILCDGDGPIMKGRFWYQQFYKPRDKSA